ncbi:Uncharacterised protein [Orientia tsutsugamushi]|uniref:hypothetical protein n=1 Tax=Orientia tsutsugamushi TaxID=784 RepID=UPI0005F8A733|nr:hypothetical protein [Orientia tsutsugamushi]KJV75609.1 hypothetical protein OTSTA763_0384 [Orientia tsutsugamushi str. TA763]SPP23980.1 Uncharacterised protein [Orientia tsutsugamushi]
MAQKLRNFASNNCKIANNNSSNNATIFYNFIENIIPRSKSRGIVQQDNSNSENTKEEDLELNDKPKRLNLLLCLIASYRN